MMINPVHGVELRDAAFRIEPVIAAGRDCVRVDEEIGVPVLELEHGLEVARVYARPRHADVAKRRQSLGTISGPHGKPLSLVRSSYFPEFSVVALPQSIRHGLCGQPHGPLSILRRWSIVEVAEPLCDSPLRAALVSHLR
jgi:hypothetical protein